LQFYDSSLVEAEQDSTNSINKEHYEMTARRHPLLLLRLCLMSYRRVEVVNVLLNGCLVKLLRKGQAYISSSTMLPLMNAGIKANGRR